MITRLWRKCVDVVRTIKAGLRRRRRERHARAYALEAITREVRDYEDWQVCGCPPGGQQ